MKTITSLNQKWWYRLIKVIYILVFIFVAGIGVMSAYSANAPTTSTDYQVVCNYGNKGTFYAFKDKGILIFDSDLDNGLASLPDYVKTELESACGISQAEIQGMISQIFANSSSTNAPSVQQLYTISPATVTQGNAWTALGYSLIALLVIILVFEIVRRAFYYIVLGSIRPSKRE